MYCRLQIDFCLLFQPEGGASIACHEIFVKIMEPDYCKHYFENQIALKDFLPRLPFHEH